MVSLGNDPPSLLYIDYEVTGFHTCLDLAKPIYLDGFFNAAYADLLYDNIPRKDGNTDIWVEWVMKRDHISIDYNLRSKSRVKPSRGSSLDIFSDPY